MQDHCSTEMCVLLAHKWMRVSLVVSTRLLNIFDFAFTDDAESLPDVTTFVRRAGIA